MTVEWTPELETTVAGWIADGYSAGEVSDKLCAMRVWATRNAVIGKAKRRGWKWKNSPHSNPDPNKIKSRRPRFDFRRKSSAKSAAKEKSVENSAPISFVSPEAYDAAIPVEQRRTLLELSNATCRFPIGNPGSGDLYFCGAEPREGLPYCAVHHARCYWTDRGR
ncbi:MAG: hypothetical protein KGL39_06230 [Patescibacteria group bacterium]|nr:hypothetical protein [Patescibacteria group bacterium]